MLRASVKVYGHEEDELAGARVLVTGASGFIGTRLCHALQERGAKVIAFVLGEPSRNPPNGEVHTIDMRDAIAVRGAILRVAPTYVVHLAALKLTGAQPQDFRASYEANLFATLDLAKAIIECGGCRRFAYLSSAEEYGRGPVPFDLAAREAPLTAYGLSKLAATQLLQALAATEDLPIAVLRATVVYGPGQRSNMFVPSLIRSLLVKKRFPMTDGNQMRDLVYVDDVIDGILRALVMSGRHDEAMHISSGAAVSIRDVALLTARLIGENAEVLIEFGALRHRPGEAIEYWASNEETHTVLGWSPLVSLEDGLQRTIEHLRANPFGD